MPTTTVPLHSPDFYAGDPYPAYRELRNTTPVVWNDVTNFWALLKYEDIRFVSGHPLTFTSTKGITIPDPTQPEPVQEGNLIFTDPPRHRQLRKLINSGFTRRQVMLLEPKVREIVRGIVDNIDPSKTQQFAEDIASPLPTRMIAEMLGAPAEDWEKFRTWSDAAVGTADPDIEMDHLVALGELYEYFTKLIAARRSGEVTGQDDLLSILAAAEVDGEQLTDADLLNFSFLLLVAGNETTRNLIALGTLALIDHPDQFALLRSNPALLPSADRGDAAVHQSGHPHGASRHRGRGDPRSTASRPATPSSCSTARPTATRTSSGQPAKSSTSLVTPIRTSHSVPASTPALAHSWPGLKPGCSSRCSWERIRRSNSPGT